MGMEERKKLKLVLQKNTIANLNVITMKKIKGGFIRWKE